MAWLDNFMASNLKAEIQARLGPTPGSSTVVSFEALQLACQTTITPPTKESDVSDAIAIIAATTGWKYKFIWPDQRVKFYL